MDERLLPVLEAFDPDHILLFKASAQEHEAIRPGTLNIQGNDGKPLTGSAREKAIRDAPPQGLHDPAGGTAREFLVEWLTPFIRLADQGKKLQLHTSITSTGSSGLTVMPELTFTTPHVAVPRTWHGDVALQVGSIIGFRHDGAEGTPQKVADDALLRFGLQGELGDVPTADLWCGTPGEELRRRSQLLDAAVRGVRAGLSDDMGAIVIGDAAEDFSLAMAYRLLLGRGLWVSNQMLDSDSVRKTGVVPVARQWLEDAHEEVGRIPCVSVSMSYTDLEAVAQRIDGDVFRLVPASEDREHLAPGEWPDLRRGLVRKVISEGVGESRSVPVERHDDGTLTMLTPFTPPAPQQSRLNDRAYWYVDIQFHGSIMPTGRGLVDEALKTSKHVDMVRSGADGLSVVTASYGFVPAGAVESAKLSHPTLITLGVRSWVGAMAQQRGLGVRYSQAGRAVQLVARRLGSRRAVIDLIAGDFQRILLKYADDQTSNEERSRRVGAEPGETSGAVVLGLNPYLTFDAMINSTVGGQSSNAAEPLRENLDALQSVGLARMGLILGCDDCGRPSFYGIDDLGQRFRCPLCAADNNLSAARWKKPHAEPVWFYDLHTALRQIASQRGDLPIRAAARLSEPSPNAYGDCSEVEFIRDGSSIAEIDLVAHVGGKVAVVEAKAGATFGNGKARRRQVNKIATVARTVRAERVILATDQTEWPAADTEELERALDYTFKGVPSPVVELMVGL
ncbi:hypothetical protein [Isoptericola sp. 178]|uniref:hypothetical protein n=1 Tax=Isoptericola sp. 178 TaxID=3064651 RepID=UPI002713D411|nr:hypothetical protein [Isoptericola sp. 178]MDO8144926.1 hypothetical protein [Isoptericola sp. 178]